MGRVVLVELDCGCLAHRVDGVVDAYGWWDCPNGHGRQRLWRLAEPYDAAVLRRHLDRRAAFIRQHGARPTMDAVTEA